MASARVLAAAVLLVLALAAGALQASADQRSVLMHVGSSPPALLGAASISIMHGLPRSGGESTLGVINPSDDTAYEANKQYAMGIILPFGILAGLGLLTWASCFGFCCSRACCDCCGGRAATKMYNPKDQLCLKVWLVLSAMAFIVLFGIGIVSNAAVSESLDTAYTRSDAVVEMMYEFNGPVKQMSDVAANALLQVQGLNSTVYSALPTAAQVSGYINCSNLMFDTVQTEQQLLADLAPVTGSTAADGTSDSKAMNLTLLAQEMLQVQASVHSTQPLLPPEMPNLAGVQSTLSAAVPSPLYDDGVVPAQRMSVAQALFRTAQSSSTAITNTLLPALTNTKPTIQPVQDVLAQYDQSAQACDAATQQTLHDNILADSTTAQTQNEIAALNQSIALLPTSSALIDAVGTFQSQFDSLSAVSLTLSAALDSYRDAIASLQLSPSFASVLTSLKASLPNYRAAQATPDNNSTRLQLSLLQTGAAVASLTSQVSDLALAMPIAAAGVETLRNAASVNTTAGAPPTLAQSMQAVNRTLPSVVCIKPLFSQLVALNSSILILPAEVSALLLRRNQILVQLQRITRIQYDLTKSFDSLAAFNDSLKGFPDLAPWIDATNQLNATLAAFPDCQQASQLLGRIGTDLDALTDSYLASLQGGLGAFNSAATNAQPDVDAIAAALDGLRQAIQGVPTLTPYTAYASSLAAAVSLLQGDLTSVYHQSTQPVFTPIVEPLKTRFLNELAAYTQVFQAAPNRATLVNQLSTLKANITGVESAIASSTITTSLSNLAAAANVYPDSTAVYTAMQRVYSNTTASPLGPLLTTSPHHLLNATLGAFPDMSATASAVSSASSSLTSQAGSLRLLEADLSTSTGFLTRSDIDVMSDGLHAMSRLVDDFPALAEPLSSLSIAASGLNQATTSLVHYRHEYYVARQSTVVFKNHIDWLRLLGYLLVLLVPTCVSVCGFTAWFAKKPMGGLYMGMCSFTMAAIFFVMCAIQLVPSVLIADQCVDMEQFLTTNFDQFGIAASSLEPWIHLNQSTKAGAIFQYFTDCSQPKPALFDVFAHPAAVLADNNINFTTFRTQVQASLANSNDTIRLRPNVYGYFDALDSDVQGIAAASLATSALFDCQRSTAVWHPFRESICSSSGVAGAISLSTCICFLFAICLLPDVCVGMIGYKRFDPKNLDEQTPEKDPYAAGLAERPKPLYAAGSPSNGAHRVHSPGPMSPSMASPQSRPFSPSVAYSPHPEAAAIDQGMGANVRYQQHQQPIYLPSGPASPSIAMPPSEVEMHAMKAQGHRASLMMALASAPQPYHAAAQQSGTQTNFAVAPDDVQVEENEEEGGGVTYEYS